MTAKNLFLLGSMVFLLSACGGSEETSQQELVSSPIGKAPSTSPAGTLNLSGVIGETITTKTQVSGAISSSRGIVGSATANAQATITLSQPNKVIQGNITFLLAVSDPDGINAVNLVLPSVNKSLAICTQECGTNFEQSIIGLSPYFYGLNAGDVRLEIWITDSLSNQVLADAITVSWQPYQIEGVTAQRDGQTINLSWQANENLNRYNVYLATEAGVTTTNIDDLENGQQFLGIPDTTFNVTQSLIDKSYQILITGIDGSGESGFANTINLAPVGGELAFSPEATEDKFQTDEDQALQGNVLINDINQYTDELRVNTDTLILPQHGILNINEEGDFTYTPTANFNGEDAFSYQVINELGLVDTAIVEIKIKAVNDAPVALDNIYSIAIDGSLVVLSPGLLNNDSDIDLDILTVDTTPVSKPERGELTLFADGSFEYQGEQNMQGEDSFQYRVIDSQGAQAIAQVTIVSSNTNIAPIATNDSYSLSEDNTLAVTATNGVLSNDTDPNGDTFFVDESFIVAPLHGQLLLATDGGFSYIPDANFNGVDQFQYRVIDSLGATATATVTLTVNSEPDNPVAQDDAYQFSKNELFEATTQNGLLINDFNIEPGDIFVNTTAITTTQNGELTLNIDGSFTYQPNQGFIGVDSFTYSISNEQGLSASAQVILSESGENTFPEANDDQFTLEEDSSATLLNVLDNDTDADGDAITISTIENTIGEVAIVNKQIEFTPPANFSGEIVLTYTITDGFAVGTAGASDTTATVTITVTPVNDAPIANTDSVTTSADTPVEIDVLANDSDIEENNLTIVSATVARGSVVVTNNKLTYTPALNSSGVEVIGYTITDGVSNASSTVSVTIIATSSNNPPVVNSDSVTINEDAIPFLIDVLANDTDPNGDPLVISAASVDKGLVSIVNNKIQYTANANFNGLATVTYTASDGNGGANSAILSITITPVNDSPIANTDSVTMDEDATPLLIDVLANDSDPDGDNLTISAASVDIGSVSIVSNKIQYTTNANFNGVATVTYTASDGNGGTSSTALSITITPVNNSPITNADSATMDEDAPPLLIDVLANDSDPDGDALTITATTADSGSVLVVNNKIQYTPSVNANGLAKISYTVDDGNGGTSNGNLLITVTPINDAPVVSNQSFNVSENATGGDTIGTINASDIENQNLSYTLINDSTGLFEINKSSGLLTIKGVSPFDFDTTPQYTLSIDVADDGTPSEATTISVTININDDTDSLIPVEDTTFGRPLSGEIELSGAFSDGEFKDSILLNTNLYFVGYNNNLDKDIVIASYTNTGAVNTAFNGNGFKIIDLGKDEEGTAIISGNGELFIGYSSFDGTNTEACLLKMSAVGTISTNSGDGNTGTKCTTLASNSVINDLEFTDNKVQGVGYSYNGSEKDSLWLKYDISSLTFEAGTPSTVDVSGRNRDDESHAIKNFGNSDLLIVGSAIGEENDLDATIRYILPDGRNNSNFNSGNTLIVDLSDEEGDDELFAIAGIDAINFTAFLGGYITRSSGEKEAAVIAIDNSGDIDDDFGDDDGIALYNIDGNSGKGNGGAIITGLEYEPMSNKIILSGTTGLDASDENQIEQLFTARIDLGDGDLVSSYGDSGINIISTVNSNQSAKSLTIDENDTLWLAGKFNDSTNEPFIASITNEANLFTDFSTDGYTSLNNVNISSDDQSMKVLKLKSGTHTNKYISASVTQYNSNNKLILTRFTSAGLVDTSFSVDGSKVISINVADKKVTLAELGDGNIIIAGTLINGASESGFIAKVDQNGYLDDSFATNGIYTTTDLIDTKVNFADVAIDSSDHIVAVGSAIYLGVTNSFAAMLKSDGKPENSFATSGTYLGNENENFEALYIDANKDIFIGGKFASGSDSQLLMLKIDDDANEIFSYLDTRSAVDVTNRAAKILVDSSANLYLIANNGTTPDQATIIKLLTDGSEDSSFAINGVGQYQLASSGNIKVTDAALDSAGNIILTGMSDSKGMLARILADGTIDTLFGSNALGYYQAEQCDNTHQFSSMLLQTDTEVVVSSTCFDGSSNNISLSKFNFYTDGAKP
ncbi:tandem-95 repeat protein [Pseudoalteromonas sp. SWN29]|uniref:Ig-like domain-containing protein n=1 Tax=Pseudoalteromonas sp. SWN29 TaxID=2792064 RepID=UPI0018CF94E4|nr:Ig-like domain-containing protein [Pseudoalteromonas sp. SWN29]MBH0025423.1 tandem-95 repeat protein [Pseudoalteromonas sp. SWN29]